MSDESVAFVVCSIMVAGSVVGAYFFSELSGILGVAAGVYFLISMVILFGD